MNDITLRVRDWWRRERTAVIAFCFVFLIYLVPLGHTSGWWNPNEMSRIALSVSLVEYGTIQVDRVLDDYHSVPQDLAVRDGHAYSDKAPGISFFGAAVLLPIKGFIGVAGNSQSPAYWPVRHILTALLVCLPAALFGVGAVRHVIGRREQAPESWLPVALLFALATPWLTYASILFSHETAGVLVGVALILARRLDDTDPARLERRAALAGLLASLGVVTEYPTALLAALVAATVLLSKRRRQSLTSFVAGASAGALVLLVYNKAAWGSFFTTGYAFKAFAEHAAIHEQGFFGVSVPTLQGLWGVLLSPSRGILFYCPLLLCVLVGLAGRWRSAKTETLLTAIAITAYVAFAAGFVDWKGGWSAAARHLVPLLPVVMVPFVAGYRALTETESRRAVAAVLVGLSVAGSLLSVAVTPYFPETFANPVGQIVVPTLREGLAMPNLVSDLTGVRALPVFLVYALVVATAAMLAFARSLPPRRRVLFTALAVAAFVLGPLAVSLGSELPATAASRREWSARLGH
jgi:hypothetical protein